jgi:hypothetical protein
MSLSTCGRLALAPLQPRVWDYKGKSVVVFVETDAGALEFPLDEGVAVEPVGGVEREEAGHADDEGPITSSRM